MTTTTHTCPPIEEIAALLDGRLEEQDRVRVVQHLDECPECYEIFVGAARFLEEEEAAASQPQAARAIQKGRVVRFPLGSSTAVRPWLPLAAAAVLAIAVGVPVYRTFLAPPRLGSTEALVRPLEGDPKLQDKLWTLDGYRGEEKSGGKRANAFLIGVHLVDRQVSLKDDDDVLSLEDLSKQRHRAASFSQQIGNALMDLRLNEVADLFYEDWTEEQVHNKQGIHPAVLLREMRDSARAREDLLERSLVHYHDFFTFGKWAEAARLAAANGNSAFFEPRGIRRFPSYFLNADFLAEEAQEFDATVHQKLREIEEILDSGDLQAEDFTDLANLLGEGGDEGPGIIELFEGKAAETEDPFGEDEYVDGLGEGSGD